LLAFQLLKYVWFLGIPDRLDFVQFLASFRCLRTYIAADAFNRFSFSSSDFLMFYHLLNYVRILVILNSLDFVQFLAIFRCLRTLIAADTFNWFLQTLAGSGFAASHCLICYHVRMTLILSCCLHCWFPVLLFILWNYLLKYIWFLGIPDLLDSAQFLASFRCLRTHIAADAFNRIFLPSSDFLMFYHLSNYVRILETFNLLDLVQFFAIFRCLRTFIAAGTFNRFPQTLFGSGFAASHGLICYHVRMIFFLGCCLHCWSPVLLFILWNYVRFLVISGFRSHSWFPDAMFLPLKLARSITNLGWPIISQCRWRSDESSSTHQISNMSTETCQESSLLKKRQDPLRQADLAKFCLDDQAEAYLFTKDKRSTFPLFSPLVERIGMHAVEPSLPPGLEASHLGSCYELSPQRTKVQEPLCIADAV
jgi:hypothetical protein